MDETLIRAEALFRRFQRLVEAIDRRNNFPAPSIRQRKAVADKDLPSHESSSTSTACTAAASSSIDTGKPVTKNEQTSVRTNKSDRSSDSMSQKQPQKVISPELRKLLSRSVEQIDEKGKAK